MIKNNNITTSRNAPLGYFSTINIVDVDPIYHDYIIPTIISYYEETETFSVKNTTIYLIKPLSWDIRTHYTLNVVASDCVPEPWTRFTSKVIDIFVTDVTTDAVSKNFE